MRNEGGEGRGRGSRRRKEGGIMILDHSSFGPLCRHTTVLRGVSLICRSVALPLSGLHFYFLALGQNHTVATY